MKSYCYDETDVLINKFDIRDKNELHIKERDFSSYRSVELELNPLKGEFNIQHLQGIHRHLFQDVYEWAGQFRTIDIAKDNSVFALNHLLVPLVKDLFAKLKHENFLKDLDIDKFSDRLTYYASEINAFHPFREGNGRTTREFLRCLAADAGYTINYSQMDKSELYQAFVNSFNENNHDLKRIFKEHIVDSIVRHYHEEVPQIIHASESLLNNLNKVKLMFSDDNTFCSYKQIQKLYKDLGSKIDTGELRPDNEQFKVLSDTVIEIRKLQSQTPQIESKVELSRNQLKNMMEPEL